MTTPSAGFWLVGRRTNQKQLKLKQVCGCSSSASYCYFRNTFTCVIIDLTLLQRSFSLHNTLQSSVKLTNQNSSVCSDWSLPTGLSSGISIWTLNSGQHSLGPPCWWRMPFINRWNTQPPNTWAHLDTFTLTQSSLPTAWALMWLR